MRLVRHLGAAALAACLALSLASAAMETTTVSGRVYTPGAQLVTSGTVDAVLNIAGTAEDGSGSQVVSGRRSAAIDPNGLVSIVLVPNDVITPANTYYVVTYNVKAPFAFSWTERWIVPTSPDPSDLGDVAVLPALLPPGGFYQKRGGVTIVPNSTSINFDPNYFLGDAVGSQGNWTLDPTKLGGVPAWASVTAGTNTSQALVVGNGSSLATAGTGTIAATSVPASGVTGPPWDSLGARTITVCPDGAADATYICHADCTSATSTCASGSAVDLARNLSPPPSTANPVRIVPCPAVFDECVSIDNLKGVHLVGDSCAATIRPAVTSQLSVVGGVLRIGTITAGRATSDIEVSGIGVWNDAWSSPNPAIAIGCTPGAGLTSCVENIYVHDNCVLGHHDAIGTLCSKENLDNEGWPRVLITGNAVVSGADAIVEKFDCNATYVGNATTVWTNYCEDPNAASVVTGTARSFDVNSLCTASATPYACCSGSGAGSCGRAALALETADASATEHYYAGRKITTSGGSCPSGAIGDFRAVTYDSVNNLVWLDASVQPSTAFDSNCSYSIAAVPMAAEAPCKDRSWRMLPETTTAYTAHNSNLHLGHKKTCFHLGQSSGAPSSANNTGQVSILDTNTCRMYLNNGFNQIAAPIQVNTAYVGERMRLAGFTADVILNEDTVETTTGSHVLGCIMATAGTIENLDVKGMACRIVNAGDTEMNIDGINVGVSASSLRIPDAFLDLSASVVGYNGAITHLVQTAGTLAVGHITSPQTVTTSGTITQLNDYPIISGAGACGSNTVATALNANTAPTCTALTDSYIPDTITVNLAATATALAADPNNCAAGNYPLGIDASGNVQSCTAAGAGSGHTIQDNGTSLPARTNLNFGNGFALSDNSGSDRTEAALDLTTTADTGGAASSASGLHFSGGRVGMLDCSASLPWYHHDAVNHLWECAALGAVTTIQDEGTSLANQYEKLSFEGSGVACANDDPNTVTRCTITGDITAVGPGYSTGAAFVDGTASTGTDMLVWEGTTADTNELKLISPTADPNVDINLTLPSSSGTLALAPTAGSIASLNNNWTNNATIAPTSGQCLQWRTQVPYAMANLDNARFGVSTGQSGGMGLAMYSIDGATQLFECANVTVTGTGSTACTFTGFNLSAGEYISLVCTDAATPATLSGASSAPAIFGTASASCVCTGANPPSTIAPSTAANTTTRPSIYVSTD